jgi:heat shock protein HslJ
MVLLVAACAIPHPQATDPLSGTTWRLHAIQSMDDAQGTTRIQDPARFTLRFGANGRASLLLGCNRATGPWKAQAGPGDGGTLTFGLLAATRALCAPPNLDERIVRDLAYVRSYRIIDGKLFMSLMADGGIYEWRPDRD